MHESCFLTVTRRLDRSHSLIRSNDILFPALLPGVISVYMGGKLPLFIFAAQQPATNHIPIWVVCILNINPSVSTLVSSFFIQPLSLTRIPTTHSFVSLFTSPSSLDPSHVILQFSLNFIFLSSLLFPPLHPPLFPPPSILPQILLFFFVTSSTLYFFTSLRSPS